MLFNSYEFIILFLPLTLIGYFGCLRFKHKVLARCFLLLASLFFYAWWNSAYLILLVGSIGLNYAIGSRLTRNELKPRHRKFLTIAGVVGNLSAIGYFKYYDFFISSLNTLGADLPLRHIVLPLAISFFTFQQIAYLVDAYRGEAAPYSWLDYALFVAFFPQLIAGPIVHHGEMIRQFRTPSPLISRNLAEGIYQFVIGLSKKVLIADTFAVWASYGFDTAPELTLGTAWLTSLSYTLQLYYDFSGYSDMALGAARMFNLKLPVNFLSPYKAVNIQDFWRRWHITLSRFLQNYLYIPLGGNRQGQGRTLLNLIITFLLGGLWHGAGWNFVFWGLLHGSALALHRLWKVYFFPLPRWLGWFLTFQFVNIAWIFFRATSWSDALKVLSAMFDWRTIHFPPDLWAWRALLPGAEFGAIWAGAGIAICLGLLIAFLLPNSIELQEKFQPRWYWAIFTVGLAAASLLCLLQVSEFLYFNF